MGNREKVEEICKTVVERSAHLDRTGGRGYAHKMVGFVDREFRGYDLGKTIHDHLGKHNILDRLVWSRGHSIENYLFDKRVFSEPLRIYAAEHFEDARKLFSSVWDSALRLACAGSLAALDTGRVKAIENSMDWKMLKLNGPELALDVKAWLNRLNQKLSKPVANRVVERFQSWHEKVQDTDIDTVRWLCHGHTGFAWLWNTFACCVYEVSQDANSARDVLKDKDHRFVACVVAWAKGVRTEQYEYPAEVLKLLELL